MLLLRFALYGALMRNVIGEESSENLIDFIKYIAFHNNNYYYYYDWIEFLSYGD